MSSAELLQTIMKSPPTSAAIDGSSLATGVSLTVNWPASGAPAVEKRRARRLVETGSSHATTNVFAPTDTSGDSTETVGFENEATSNSPPSASPLSATRCPTIVVVPLASRCQTTTNAPGHTATRGTIAGALVSVLTR